MKQAPGSPLNQSRVLCAQSCPPLCDPVDCSLLGSSDGISQARILEWVAISCSRGSSPPRDQIRTA